MQSQATAQQRAQLFRQTLTPAERALLATYNLAYLRRRFAARRNRHTLVTKPKKTKNQKRKTSPQ